MNNNESYMSWLKSPDGLEFADRVRESVLKYKSSCVMPEHILLAIWETPEIRDKIFAGEEELYEDTREKVESYLEASEDAPSPDTSLFESAFCKRYWKKVRELCYKDGLTFKGQEMAILLLALLYEDDSYQQFVLFSIGFDTEALYNCLDDEEPFVLAERKVEAELPLPPPDIVLDDDDDDDDDDDKTKRRAPHAKKHATNDDDDDDDDDDSSTGQSPAAEVKKEERPKHGSSSEKKPDESIPRPLRPFLSDLVERAKDGKIDEVVGRLKETEEMMRCLNRKKKSAPLLIGAPGVGKTAVVEGLALRIAQGDVPGIMKDIHIYSLNVNGSISGANCRGDFEKRLNDTFAFIEKQPNAILFIDELHSFLNADRGGGSSGGEAIKPEITSGKLRCIATTTDEDYRKYIAPDKAFARRFQTIQISEPTADDCVHILSGIKGVYEAHHHIRIHENQLKRIVELSIKYLPGLMLPDKAIDILDTVGSKYRLHSKDNENASEEDSSSEENWAVVTNEDIDAVVCSMAKLPSIPSADGTGNDNDFAEMATLEDKLKSKVFGQDQAVKELVRALKIAKTGLMSERAGTLGNFFFAGPTGVGKTEICKSLAEAMHMKLVRFDMSEYQSDQMLTRFVGSAPGYVGFEGGGQLTNAVRDNPNCVLLLDEIEKAHSAIHNLLLQVMDDGELTDSRGFKTDFHNAIIIMTSNAGCTEASAKSMRLGFGANQSGSFDDSIIQSAMKKAFSPEFRARLTASVVFKELGDKEMAQIVDYKFNEIVKKASTRGYSVKLTDEARNKIVEKALDAKQGARPVEKILNDVVRAPLADLIVASGSQREFSLVLKEDELTIE